LLKNIIIYFNNKNVVRIKNTAELRTKFPIRTCTKSELTALYHIFICDAKIFVLVLGFYTY